MPKRKRSAEDDIEKSFEDFSTKLFRAFKAAKGFERQRLTKRSRDPKLDQRKIQRHEQEILVLKSLDLHQAATAHLCSALLKIKGVADSPRLPESIKQGVPKPEISEEERIALHNVTSALCNRKQVRDVINLAIPTLCRALGVEPPEKAKGKGAKASAKEKSKEATTSEKGSSKAKESRRAPRDESDDEDDPSDGDAGEVMGEDLDDGAIDRMEAMLGGSSSEEEGDSGDESVVPLTKKSKPGSFDDDISLPGSDSVPEDLDDGSDDDISLGSSSGSESDSEVEVPPPKKKKKSIVSTREPEKTTKGTFMSALADGFSDSEGSDIDLAPPSKNSKAKMTPKGLPALIGGGYISGSEEEASDIDVAPVRKNRRGQKARQALAEKKYGDKAKHLGKEKDTGWDARRGAVDGQDGKPWKKGVRNPLVKGSRENDGGEKKEKEKKKTRDDDGPLHPSWLAKKKAKQAQENVSFQGKKITFD